MSFLLALLPQIWPWGLSITAILLICLGARRIGLLLLTVWMGAALVLGLMTPMGVAIVICAIAGAALLPRASGILALFGHVSLVLFCVALAAHLLPGFHNIKTLDAMQSGPLSTPYTLYLNFDKPLILVLLVLAWPRLNAVETPFRPWPVVAALGLTAALYPLAITTGVIALEPTVPAWWLIFLLANLLQTCLVEEAFFRSYLQRAAQNRLGPVAALLGVSLLFGAAHVGGGALFAAFAGLLGLACGIVFLFSGRLWAAVALHFAFNAGHLLFFTYPALA